jgi:formate dehydrogenase alpha subunit
LGIKLTINGRQIEAKPGQKIIEAAKDHGIKIPHLCYHGQIGSIGSCRLCLVEVKPGPPKPVPACTTTVAEGMEVQTHTEKVINLRRELVQLLLLNHPLDCPICDAAGECKLQKVVHELGITEQRWRATPTRSQIDYDSPLIERHPERCIHCGRCVTICERIIGAEGVYFAGRGYDTAVEAGGRPLDCEFCGSCVGVCPVGALIDKTFKYRARSWELAKFETTCPYCAGGCRLELNVSDNRVRRVTSNHKITFNRGLLCGRGRFGHGFIGSPDRLTSPLIRRNGALVPASWEEAIAAAAKGLLGVREKTGAVSIYALGSPRVSTEANYLLQKLVRVNLGTHHIDTQARYGYLPALKALADAFGPPRLLDGKLTGFSARCGTLAEIAASDAVLVLGADARPELPSACLGVIAAARNGAQVVVADMRPTKLDRFATVSLRYGPGGEVACLSALAKALLAGASEVPGLPELAARLEGRQFEELLHKTSPSQAAITRADIEVVAAILAGAARPAVVFGADLYAMGQTSAKVRALANLLLLLKPEARLYPLAPKANSYGSLVAGCCPEYLPGFAPIPAAAPFEKRWGAKLGSRAASFPEMVASGKLRGLYCVGANPLRGWPGTAAVEAALEGLEFLVVQDIFMSGVAAKADVVLPAACYGAGGGTFLNTEGRPGSLAAAVEEPGLLPDWELVARLSSAMGTQMSYGSAKEVWAELNDLVPLLARPFEEVQALPRELGGRLSPQDLPEAAASGFTLLVAGSLFHSGTLSTRAAGACAIESEGRVLLSAADHASLGLADEVRLEANGQSLIVPVAVGRDVPQGMVVAPDHFANVPIHRLTTDGYMVRVAASRPKGGGR